MGSVGSKFGPYELERRLGAGGMAETFVAVRRGPGGFEQRVCLKRILPAFEADEEFVRQFLHEARLSATLRHTNIAQVIDFGVHDGSHYLALELIEGTDLRGLLKATGRQGRTLPAGLVALMAADLAAALDHAAEREVVHRDISPSNVLLSTAGEVKLTDFGIARAASQPGVTRTGIIKGKVPYMAPEYANRGRCDGRSDLFGLGVVLFECLAGERPYDGATDLETVARSSSGSHRPLAELAHDAPAPLVTAVERLIAPAPEDRFGDAGDLLDALADAPPPPRARRELGRMVRELRPAAGVRLAAPNAQAAPGARAEPDAQPTRAERPASPEPAEPHSESAGDIGSLPTEAAPAPPTATQAWPDARPEGAPPIPSVPAPSRVAGPEEPTRTRVSDASGNDGSDDGEAGDENAADGDGETGTPRATTPGTPPLAGWRRWTAAASAVGLAAAVLLAVIAWPSAEPDDPAPTEEPTELAGTTPVAAPPPEPATAAPPTADPEPAEAEQPAEPSATAEPAAPEESESTKPPHDQDTEGSKQNDPDPTRVQADPERRRRTRPTRGKLHVSVVPYGDVWVDGRHIGRAPVEVWVRPGSHTVATGDRAPEKSTTVRVRAGRTRQVILR